MTIRDASGSPNGQTEYDAYGREVWTGIQTDRGSYRFAGAKGYQNDDPSGMQLLGARYYLPALGRFLTQDPIGQAGGLNLYAYCGDSPLMRTDANGLNWRWPPFDGDLINRSSRGVYVWGEPGYNKPGEMHLILPGRNDWPGYDVDHFAIPGKDGRWHYYHVNGAFHGMRSGASVMVDDNGPHLLGRSKGPFDAGSIPEIQTNDPLYRRLDTERRQTHTMLYTRLGIKGHRYVPDRPSAVSAFVLEASGIIVDFARSIGGR